MTFKCWLRERERERERKWQTNRETWYFIHWFFFFSTHPVAPFDRLVLLMVTSMASKIAISSTLAILMTCTVECVAPEKRRLCGYTSTIWTRVWLLSGEWLKSHLVMSRWSLFNLSRLLAPYVGATSVFGQLGEVKMRFSPILFEFN